MPDSTEGKYFTVHNALINVLFEVVDGHLGMTLYEVFLGCWLAYMLDHLFDPVNFPVEICILKIRYFSNFSATMEQRLN